MEITITEESKQEEVKSQASLIQVASPPTLKEEVIKPKSIKNFQESKQLSVSLPQSLNTTMNNQMSTNVSFYKNKIFLENSPERKTHDNMLLNTSTKKVSILTLEQYKCKNEESIVYEKVKSTSILPMEIYNEVMIAKQEKSIKAYTQKYFDN